MGAAPRPPGHDRLPGPDLSRRARAHLVGGARRAGSWRRALRHRQHRLRADRPRQRGQRVPGRPARVPADRSRHRAAHQLRHHHARPAHRRRLGRGDDPGRPLPGGGRRERPGPLRVAQPRPHPDQRVLLATHRRLGLRPPELDRGRPGRQPPRVLAQHAHDLQARPPERRDHLAPGRSLERLLDRVDGRIRVAARRAAAARRVGDDVRQRLRALAGPAAHGGRERAGPSA